MEIAVSSRGSLTTTVASQNQCAALFYQIENGSMQNVAKNHQRSKPDPWMTSGVLLHQPSTQCLREG